VVTSRHGSVKTSKEGWLLVTLIILLGIVILAFGGVTLLLTEHFRSVSLRQNQTRAIYLAQAGVMQAIYDVKRMTASVGGVSFLDPATSQEYVVDAGPAAGTSDDDIFTLGGLAADFFLVNMKGTISVNQANLCSLSNRDRFRGWSITNVLSSAGSPLGIPITVDKVRVNWNNPLASDRVLRIDLNNTTVYSNCTGALVGDVNLDNGGDADITNTTINPRQIWPAGNQDRIWFNTTYGANFLTLKTSVDLIFTMTDGSIRRSHYEATVANRSADVTLKSVGEVRKGAFPFVMWRRLQAEYRFSGTALTSAGNILSYQELSQKTP